MSLPKPYYQDDAVTIYHSDCRDILPELPKVDLVLTDPPYESQHKEYGSSDISCLNLFDCQQLVFWSARDVFPLSFTARHVWNKMNGTITRYEFIYERNGSGLRYMVYSGPKIHNSIDAKFNRDLVTGHPSQKPRKIILPLIAEFSSAGEVLLDPFLGSGTISECAKKLGRKCIGIEIEEKYCEIAARRCSQTVMDLQVGGRRMIDD